MLSLVNSTVEDVSRKERLGYDAVKGAVRRCIRTRVDWDEFAELGVMGIDEIALRKGRKNYGAIITSKQTDGRVVVLAVLPDRKKETVRQFPESIPRCLWPTMATVCTAMWDGYVNAAHKFAAAHPEVSLEVVTDRYHVAKNYPLALIRSAKANVVASSKNSPQRSTKLSRVPCGLYARTIGI